MSGPFRKKIEPLFARLSGYIADATNLIERQTPQHQEGDDANLENGAQPLTAEEYALNVRALQERIADTVSRLETIDANWTEYVHSCTGQLRTAANDEYSNFVLGDPQKHFAALIDEGNEAKMALKQSLPIAPQSDARTLDQSRISHNPDLTQSTIQEVRPTAPVLDPEEIKVLQPPTQIPADFNTIQLPKMKPPTFEGDPLKWTTFWDLFEVSIHSKNISNVEKMSYLISSLKGDALLAVSGYQISNANYQIVVDLLKARYGNYQAIAETLQAELIGLPRATDATASLRSLSESIERICRQMSAMRLPDDHPIIATTIKSKLPHGVRTKLVERERAAGNRWSTAQLRHGLQEIIAIREEVQRTAFHNEDRHDKNDRQKPQQSQHKKRYDQKNSEPTRTFVATTAQKNQSKPKNQCFLCEKGLHWVSDCKIVKDVEQRKKKLAEQQRCFLCLRKNHRTPDCRSKRTCLRCKGRHNSLICNKSDERQKQNTHVVVQDSDPHTFTVAAVTNDQPSQPREVLLMAKEATVTSSNGKNQSNAMIFFDCGSQTSFITHDLAKKLNLKKLSDGTLEVYAFQQQPVKFQSAKYSIKINLLDGTGVEVVLNATNKIATGFKTATLSKKQPKLMEIHHLLKHEQREPDILIGMADFWQFLKMVEKIQPNLYLINTTIGPILCGQTQLSKLNQKESTISTVAIGTNFVTSKDEINKFWSLEAIGIHDNPEEKDDEIAMDLFNKSVRYVNGRYSVRWPWKEAVPDLPTNFQLSYCRLRAALNKLHSSPELLQEYDKVIKDQLAKGIIEPAIINEGGLEHYLPHQPVIRLDKTSTRLRVVYDASARLKDSASLNQCLYKGPTLLPDLAGMLMRFRTHNIVLLCDIEKAFLMIELEDCDRNVSKFLWLKDPSKPLTQSNLRAFRFTRVFFGNIASPFLTAATILHHLRKYNGPLAIELGKNMYVDNALMSANTPDEAIHKYRESKQIFLEAGMNLREYISNSTEVNNAIAEKDRLDKTLSKVLGIPWNSESDELSINFLPKEDFAEKNRTKRNVLSDLASTYDPLGLISPAILPAKIFFQKLWAKIDTESDLHPKKDWDRQLSSKDAAQWNSLVNTLSGQTIKVPRYVPQSGINQVHCYVDASKDAYAAAIYIRCNNGGSTVANLILSKNRLKPNGGMTIPRMELMAILIGVRLLKFAEAQLHQNFDQQFLWSDSQCALRWIASTDDKTKFVANRLKEIRQYTKCAFRFVPTLDNPADLSTRGCTPMELAANQQWWHGPPWLIKTEKHWPQILEVSAPTTEVEDTTVSLPATILLSTLEPLLQIERFSSWTKLVRTTAYVLRYLRIRLKTEKFHKSTSPASVPLSADELENAQHYLLLNHQKSTEITPKDIANFKLFLDPDGIYRVSSRIHNAELPENSKTPIFLHRKNRLASLIIQHCHEKSHHAGVNSTLTKFLSEFWILHARKEVRKVTDSCVICKKMIGKPFALPTMPQLPADRVTVTSPWDSIGLDYAGPTMTKCGESKKKAWILLITCLSTRAVYLDVITDLGTTSFLQAFRRFVARRAKPSRILSDNQAAFKTADVCLTSTWQELMQNQEFANFYSNQRITWKFTPAFSPWFGAVYERLNALLKDAFKKVIGRKVLPLEELQTFVAEVESTMNNRPLSYVGTEADSPMPLRPIDFIQPKSTIVLSGPLSSEDEWKPKLDTRDKILAIWEKTTAFLDDFWDRWKKEYLLILRHRNQVDHKGPHLQNHKIPHVNEMVLVEEDNQPRNVWQLGKIVELIDSHGAVRTAKVLMPNKHILTRPINRLYSLEVTEKTTAESQKESIAEPEETNRGIEQTKEGARYNLRDRTKLKVPQKALFYTLITALALAALGSALPLETNSTCSTCEVKCSKYGVQAMLPSHIIKAEICCQGDDCRLFHQESTVNHKLPDSLLVNDYSCSVHLWKQQSIPLRSIELACPAKQECDLIDCYICSRRFENPECLPTATTIVYGVGISFTLIALFVLMKLLKDVFTGIFCCFSGLACICKCFSRICCSRKRAHSDDEPLLRSSKQRQNKLGFRLKRLRPFSFSSGRTAMAIIGLATLVAMTEQCSEVISINAKEERCDILKNETRCTISDTTEITLLPAGQTVCLYMKGIKGENMGTVKLKMDHVKITCIPKAEFSTRSYVMKVQPSHRCPTQGLCEDDYCSTVTTSTLVKEDGLEEANKYPGNSYCRDSCTTWDCTPWCALPTASCLFYRTYAVPITETVFEVFSCPDWRYGVEVFLQLETNSTVEQVNVSLIEGLTSHWKDISLSTVSITRPPSPVFGRQFMTDGTNTAMINKFTSHLFCPNASAAESFTCEVSPEACINCQQAVTKEGVKVSCHCKDQQLEEIIENPNLRLPVMAGRYDVKNQGKEVFTESHHTPVQLIVKINSMKVIAAIEGSICTIKPYNLSGCYRCDTGGEFHFECSTDFGQALATVKCADNTFFTQSCNKSALQYSAVLHFTEGDINTNCTVECPGGNTEFYLQGQLQYIPMSQQVELIGKYGKDDKSDDNLKCLLNICVEDYVMNHLGKFFASSYYLLGVIILISGLIIGCVIRCNPMFRLWRSSYRLISILVFILVISSFFGALETATNNKAKHPQFGEAHSADNESHESRQISINGREIHSEIIFSQTPKFFPYSSIFPFIEMSKKAAKIARIKAALAQAEEEPSSESESEHSGSVILHKSEVGEFVSNEAIEVRGKKRAKELQCSACKQFGHIRTSKKCPMNTEKMQPACPTRPLPPGKTPPVSAATPDEDEEERAIALLKAGEEMMEHSRSEVRDSEEKQSLESNGSKETEKSLKHPSQASHKERDSEKKSEHKQSHKSNSEKEIEKSSKHSSKPSHKERDSEKKGKDKQSLESNGSKEIEKSSKLPSQPSHKERDSEKKRENKQSLESDGSKEIEKSSKGSAKPSQNQEEKEFIEQCRDSEKKSEGKQSLESKGEKKIEESSKHSFKPSQNHAEKEDIEQRSQKREETKSSEKKRTSGNHNSREKRDNQPDRKGRGERTPEKSNSRKSEKTEKINEPASEKRHKRAKTCLEDNRFPVSKENGEKTATEEKKSGLDSYVIPKLDKGWQGRIRTSVEQISKSQIRPQREIPPTEELKLFIREEVDRKMEILQQEMRQMQRDMARSLEEAATILRNGNRISPERTSVNSDEDRHSSMPSTSKNDYHPSRFSNSRYEHPSPSRYNQK